MPQRLPLQTNATRDERSSRRVRQDCLSPALASLKFCPAWAILIPIQSIIRLTLLSIRRLAGGVKPGRQDGIMFMETATDRIRPVALVVALATLLVLPATSPAQSGTWTNTNSGLWSDASNWSGGSVADGIGSTGDFSRVDVTADVTVHLDSARTNGYLVFGDTATNTPAGWTLDDNGDTANILTLAGGTPSITATNLGAGKSVTISAPVDVAAANTDLDLVIAGREGWKPEAVQRAPGHRHARDVLPDRVSARDGKR